MKNKPALFAIFKRNFVGYFSSPIGYVFICAFVLMSAFASFWPNDFFNDNLANLDQLNELLPWILLVFIPAITMSIWADERRQGTDELLLTLPATDMEVVLGKYLAAVAIYTVSLAFSLSNLAVLAGLGNPDYGLLFANYAGYWIAGAAMISVGMVASFLTDNLTVGFVLAAAFNAPFIFAQYAGAIVPGSDTAVAIESFSLAARFEDFGKGLITLSGVVYFASIIVAMLYLASVLIGRRHWVVRTETIPMAAHYGLRIVAVGCVAVGVNVLAGRFDLRLDTTSERLSSLSPHTRTLLAGIDSKQPVFVEAYVSPRVPEEYVPTRLNLLSMLRELDKAGGDAVVVRVHDTERHSREASEASEQFGIEARQVTDFSGGRIQIEEIHLGLAFTSGLDKVVVPFVDRGIPIEYEIVRSIATVSDQERLKLGVVVTDAKLFGGFDMNTMSSRPDSRLVTELRKQYDVVQVTVDGPIADDYDVLLAVQPSSLTQAQLANFIAAVGRGTPTAIFEDPFPYLTSDVPGTSAPRKAPPMNPFMQQNQPPPTPKGNIQPLFEMLGVAFAAETVVWDDYNPHPKIQEFEPEFVFVGDGSGSPEAFNRKNPITAGLQEVAMLFAGSIMPLPGADVTVTPLMRTGRETGVVPYGDLLQTSFMGRQNINPDRRHVPTRESYVLAVHVTGEVEAPSAAPPVGPAAPPAGALDELPGGEEANAADQGGAAGVAAAAPAKAKLNVVVVADMDVLHSAFFGIREAGKANSAAQLDFDNVTLTLNTLDYLAADDRFLQVRSRRPKHRTLTAVEQHTEKARTDANDERRRFEDDFESKRAEEETALQTQIDALNAREDVDLQEKLQQVALITQVGQQRLQARIETLQKDRDRQVEAIERQLALETRSVQNRYKLLAVGLPPLPPLIVAFIVYLRRRSTEKIGVPLSRLRGSSATALKGAA